MLASPRWRLPSFPILACLVFWLIASSSFINSDLVTPDDKLTPQAATPPKHAFDQYDDYDQDDSPASPSPATPPKLDSTYTKVGFDNMQLPTLKKSYQGKEYRLKRFVIRPAELKLEGYLLLTLIIYITISCNGKLRNEKAVQRWLNENSQILLREFSHVGHGLPKGYIANGPALFYGYATGRRGCQSLTISFALRPRQDIPFMIYEELRAAIDFSWTGGSDRIELVWALSPNNQQQVFEPKDSFVWALVEKRVMNFIREDRWDVRTFTEVKESDQLPPQLVFMSESGEITEQIVKNKELGFAQIFQNNPSHLQWFESLVLSGSPQEEPLISDLPLPAMPYARTLTLRMRLPPPSHTLDTLPLLQLSFNLIDILEDRTISLTSTTTAKITKRRTEVSNLLLEEERKILERQKEDERRKRLKAAQDEKLSKMSPAEQRKFDERERRRNAAKIGKATVKRK